MGLKDKFAKLSRLMDEALSKWGIDSNLSDKYSISSVAETGSESSNHATNLSGDSFGYMEKSDTRPFIEGCQNQSAQGKAVPFVMGEVKLTGYKLNDGFYSIEGDDGVDQFYNVMLSNGYNNHHVKKVYIGDTEVLDIDNVELQDGIYDITGKYSKDNLSKVEISNTGSLILNKLNKKVVLNKYNEEISHPFGEAADPIIKSIGSTALTVEVGIKFDGLRAYDSTNDVYYNRAVKINPYWSNDNGLTWNKFYFDIKNGDSSSYVWSRLSDSEIESAIGNGYLRKNSVRKRVGLLRRIWVDQIIAVSEDYRVSYTGEITTEGDLRTCIVERRVYAAELENSNIINRNTVKTIRFTAQKTFTASESYGKEILIKVERENPMQEDSAQETAILMYIQTYCYDAETSTSSQLIPCAEQENPLRDMTQRMGVRVVAKENTETTLNSISILTEGMAKTWNGTQWSVDDSPMSLQPESKRLGFL